MAQKHNNVFYYGINNKQNNEGDIVILAEDNYIIITYRFYYKKFLHIKTYKKKKLN